MFDWLGVWLVRGLSQMLQAMPLDTGLFLGRVVGVFLAKTHRRRQLAYANLKAAFGGRYSARERKGIVQSVFQNLAQNVVETLRFPKMNKPYLERYIEVEHRERYEELIRGNHGTVLITPHFGNWELSQVLSALVGKPLYVLAREQKHSRLDNFLNELRSVHGSISIRRGGGVRNLIRELQKGGTVGVLGDLSGGRSGTVVRFFGRKTTAPSGIFQIARKTRSVILPCFMVRLEAGRHRVFVEQPLAMGDPINKTLRLQEDIQNYYHLLENWITDHPDQWFWVYKRWKHCFTKRILVLRDERRGHSNQSEAIAREFERLHHTGGRSYEFEFQYVDVRFKSDWCRKLFFLFAFLIRPFAQGNLSFLDFFLKPECAQACSASHADIIISAGSSLAPLNLLLKKENLAQSIVVMKPSFPYLWHFFDLLIVPAHDALPKRARNIIRTWVTPSRVDQDLLQASARELRKVAHLSSNGARRIGVFIGGDTKSYRFHPGDFRKWLITLKKCAEESNFELLITTSRRTDPEISSVVKEELGQHPLTKLLVIANEFNLQNVTYGMLALTDIVLVTEDSISMISDAVSAGKTVLVIEVGNGKLPKKHSRFRESLESNALVNRADASSFRAKLSSVSTGANGSVRERQSQLIQEALRKLIC
ncbi:MAG: mitochondrial fission ELM1 family protein [Candidatus Omnitrophica bacterium]|nr:mitochondrial fission ELM1 family protein [Candidatus Omnitrophota bacterium]